MRNIFIIILIFSCTPKPSSQQKAEASVKRWIAKNAFDPESYKPVVFSAVDSHIVYYVHDAPITKLDSMAEEYNEMIRSGDTAGSASLYSTLLKAGALRKDHEFMWSIYHKYRAKNASGRILLNEGTFYLDTNYTVKSFQSSDDSLLIQKAGIFPDTLHR